MSFKKVAFVLLFLSSVVSLYSQSLFSGSVISKADKKPIVGASLVVRDTRIGTVTNESGKFELKIPAEMLQDEMLTFYVKAEGFDDEYYTVLTKSLNEKKEFELDKLNTAEKKSKRLEIKGKYEDPIY